MGITTDRIDVDICVVGGGIAGLTCTRALVRRGARVALLERGRLGGGAGYVAAGMLAPLVEARLVEGELVRFSRECLDFWPGFVQELEAEAEMPVDYRQEGTLFVAVERDHVAAIRHLYDEHRELDLPVERLSGYECRKLEPYLAPGVPEGLFSGRDHQIDNRLVLEALTRICRSQAGVRIVEECGDAVLERSGDGTWVFRTETVVVSAPKVVAATGASLSVLAGIAPELVRIVRPEKGQIVRLDQSKTPILEHVVRTPEMYMAPKSDGTK